MVRMGRWTIAISAGLMATQTPACLILSAFARPQVALVAKSSMVIWDPDSKTEHLVQSLALLSKAEKFDCLIPTPTKPTVSIVGQSGFRDLYEYMNPKRAKRKESVPDADFSATGIQAKPVDEFTHDIKIRVIDGKDILDLSKWMEENKYPLNSANREWIQRYVNRRWYFTAIHVDSKQELLKTDAVRMSFKTDTPYCPNFAAGPTWLRGIRQEVYVVSPNLLQGKIGTGSEWKGTEMAHKYVERVATEKLARNLKLKPNEIPAKSWASWSVEVSSEYARKDDLYFFPAKSAVAKAKH